MNKGLVLLSVLLLSLSVRAQVTKKKVMINDSTWLKMEERIFDKHKHDIVYGENDLVHLIDQKLVYGTDGNEPKTQLSLLKLSIDKRVFNLSTNGMFDPKVSLRSSTDFVFLKNFSGYVVRGVFSNAAGVYGAEWFIVNDKSFLTLVTSDRKILDGFIFKNVRHEEPE